MPNLKMSRCQTESRKDPAVRALMMQTDDKSRSGSCHTRTHAHTRTRAHTFSHTLPTQMSFKKRRLSDFFSPDSLTSFPRIF